jgi:hypothetical protein
MLALTLDLCHEGIASHGCMAAWLRARGAPPRGMREGKTKGIQWRSDGEASYRARVRVQWEHGRTPLRGSTSHSGRVFTRTPLTLTADPVCAVQSGCGFSSAWRQRR